MKQSSLKHNEFFKHVGGQRYEVTMGWNQYNELTRSELIKKAVQQMMYSKASADIILKLCDTENVIIPTVSELQVTNNHRLDAVELSINVEFYEILLRVPDNLCIPKGPTSFSISGSDVGETHQTTRVYNDDAVLATLMEIAKLGSSMWNQIEICDMLDELNLHDMGCQVGCLTYEEYCVLIHQLYARIRRKADAKRANL